MSPAAINILKDFHEFASRAGYPSIHILWDVNDEPAAAELVEAGYAYWDYMFAGRKTIFLTDAGWEAAEGRSR
jgi:hypothetical protein